MLEIPSRTIRAKKMDEPELLPNGIYRLRLPVLSPSGRTRVYVSGEDSCTHSHPHELLFRRHVSKKEHPLLPQDKTVFLVNLPIDSTKEQITGLFQACGKIQRVVVGRVDDDDTETAKEQAAPHKACETGYVVFKKPTSLNRLSSIRSYQWNAKLAAPLGLNLYIQQHASTCANRASLEQMATAVIAEYDQRKVEEDLLSKAKTIDEEGFILVTRRKGTAAPAADKIKPKDTSLKDFYRFQMREEKRSRLLELRDKFEQDKKKIEELRKSRRFKPY